MTSTTWTTFTRDELPTTIIGREIRFVPSVGSTNDILKDAARNGTPEGLVVITDEQTAGRGRRGRSWTAPTGTSLLLSILLRPTWLPPNDAFLLTMLAAVAAAEALETSGFPITLKWPNDVQINGRKLGGILVETELSDTQLQWCVIGCGINVNWNPRSIPELADTATSSSAEHGTSLDRREVLHAFLTQLDARYVALRQGLRSALFANWKTKLSTLNQNVRAETPQGVLLGRAVDVTPEGALILRDEQGERHIITAGDVSIRPGDATP